MAGPPCRGGGAVALWRANGHLVDRGPRGSASARCCCFAALTSVSSDQGGFYYGRADRGDGQMSLTRASPMFWLQDDGAGKSAAKRRAARK